MRKRKLLFILAAFGGMGISLAQPPTEVQPVDSLQLLSKQILSLQEEITLQRDQFIALQDLQQADKLLSFPLLLAILAIIISIVAFVFAYKKNVSQKPSTSEQSNSAEGQIEKKGNYLLNEVRRLENELLLANKRIDQFATALDNLKRVSSESVVSSSVNSPLSPQQQLKTEKAKGSDVSQFQKKTFYADLLDGDGIAVDDLKESNSEYMLLKVVVISPTEAQFEVNDMLSAQQTLVSSYKFTIGNFVNSSSNSNSAQRIVTRIPGRLRLNGDHWVLEKKAVIVLE